MVKRTPVPRRRKIEQLLREELETPTEEMVALLETYAAHFQARLRTAWPAGWRIPKKTGRPVTGGPGWNLPDWYVRHALDYLHRAIVWRRKNGPLPPMTGVDGIQLTRTPEKFAAAIEEAAQWENPPKLAAARLTLRFFDGEWSEAAGERFLERLKKQGKTLT